MYQSRLLVRIAAWLLLSGCSMHAATVRADEVPLVVFAAASLTNALQEAGDDFTRETSVAVRFSFAASSALARQIENGSPADLFFSADLEWMDYLQKKNLLKAGSRHDLLGNALVLIAPRGSNIRLTIAPRFPLLRALGAGRLATGDPDSVPVGRYARAALSHLGLWTEVAPRLVRADSVRSALAFVDRGEAPLGIVYRTDALVDKNVQIVDTFPEDSHDAIVYPAALTSAAKPQADKLLTFLRTPASLAIFERYGFTALR
jgi:molybdate transport system substrate-binding protein